MPADTFDESQVGNMAGKTAFITGANTGIGYEAARVLAGRGARVLLGCRSAERADAAVEKIRGLHPAADIKAVDLDLGSLASVRHAAEHVCHETRLDLLINNAGIMMPPRGLTQDGFESQFGVNHLGHFALTGLLLQKLSQQPRARVVTVSSIAHRGGSIDFNDLNAEKGYSAQARYGMSKLANLLFSYELHRRLRAAGLDVMSVACHPGVAETELFRYPPPGYDFFMMFVRPWLNTPAMGAWPTLRAASHADVVSGECYGPLYRFETAGPAVKVSTSSASHNEEVAARLWELSLELTDTGDAYSKAI